MCIPTPILDLTGTEPNLDWPNATYDVDFIPKQDGWTVSHFLAGAPALSDLIATGAARWAVELRCPETMYSTTFVSDPTEYVTEVNTNSDVSLGSIDLWPGLISVTECQISTVDLSDIWRTDDVAQIGVGYWLAKHNPLQPDTGASLVAFMVDESLSKGELTIRLDASSGQPIYVVRHHPSQSPRYSDQGFLVTVFSTAFAMVANEDDFELSNDTESGEIRAPSRFVLDLARQLQASEIPLWNDEDWDPMKAATSLLELPLPAALDAELES